MLKGKKKSHTSLWEVENHSSLQFYMSPCGCGLVGKQHDLLIPWSALTFEEALQISEVGRVSLQLKGEVPGVDYLILNSPQVGDEELGDFPYSIEEGVWSCLFPLKDPEGFFCHWRGHWNHWQQEVEERLPPSQQSLEAVDLRYQWVEIAKGSGVHFPRFCPHTGEPCDELERLGEGGEELLWLSSSQRRERKKWKRRALWGATLGFFATAWQGWGELWEVQQFWLMAGWSWLALLPLGWRLALPGLWIEPGEGKGWRVGMRDPEYFRAFVEANTPLDPGSLP